MIRLYNRGDGVNGHYCVGRPIKEFPNFYEFWNEPLDKWTSTGTTYSREDGERLIEFFNTREIMCGMQ
jgi:CRISPR/Cas system CSM-associated protein Csm2 small subunit